MMSIASMARHVAAYLLVAGLVTLALYYSGPFRQMTDIEAREMRFPPYDGPISNVGPSARVVR